ncbi:cytochrome P450 [Lentzea sp. NPDC059081]|uniref:cytochrome P450 family protein n=1 Tax=Lentzea sp. NPDC059081 TaxID=3346719 RepID=UPI0036A1A9EB
MTTSGPVPDVLGKLSLRDLMIDPYGTLGAIQESCPALPVESVGYRMWVITRHEDVRRVLADPTVLRDVVEYRREINAGCMVRPMRRAHLPHASRRSFFDRDGENHHRLRSLVGGFFTPVRLNEVRPRVEQVVRDVLDALPTGEPVDLVSRFAMPISGTVCLEMLGIPVEDRDLLGTLSRGMISSLDIDEIERSAQGLFDYAKALIPVKRASSEDDLCSSLLQAHDNGQMTEDELASTYLLMIITSFEPASAIGSGALALISHPNQLATLVADPRLFDSCVDEVVRYESPFRFLPPRYTSAALEVGGVTIPAGELLLVSPGAANRDPAWFPAPEVFEVTRDTVGHLGFGHGAHRCVGAALGRMQTSTALRALFERYPEVRLAAPSERIRWQPGKFMRRLQELAVVLSDQ